MHIDTENHSKYPLRTCKFQNFLGRHPDPPRLSCYAAELLLATIAWPLDHTVLETHCKRYPYNYAYSYMHPLTMSLGWTGFKRCFLCIYDSSNACNTLRCIFYCT